MSKKEMVKGAIKGVLAACGQYAMSADILKTECEFRLYDRIGERSFRSALSELKQTGIIQTRRSHEDGKLRWFKACAMPLQTA